MKDSALGQMLPTPKARSARRLAHKHNKKEKKEANQTYKQTEQPATVKTITKKKKEEKLPSKYIRSVGMGVGMGANEGCQDRVVRIRQAPPTRKQQQKSNNNNKTYRPHPYQERQSLISRLRVSLHLRPKKSKTKIYLIIRQQRNQKNPTPVGAEELERQRFH